MRHNYSHNKSSFCVTWCVLEIMMLRLADVEQAYLSLENVMKGIIVSIRLNEANHSYNCRSQHYFVAF